MEEDFCDLCQSPIDNFGKCDCDYEEDEEFLNLTVDNL